MRYPVIKSLCAALLPLSLCLSNLANAEWALDNSASSLSYVTSKAAAISEVNTFTELRGGITDDGQATLVIGLTSVNTQIDVRNERMRNIVFQTQQYPSAVVTVDVSSLDIGNMVAGESQSLVLPARFSLHGITETVTSNMRVTKLSNGGVQVENTMPILISAATFGLAAAVEELRELAGLPSINPNVSVDFSLVYELY